MADKKISALEAYTTPIAGDVIPIVDTTNATTKKIDAGYMLNSSMARQAIINGNFDVWQRGTSFTLADAVGLYTADRWRNYADGGGGTLPTLTVTKQAITPGDISNTFYHIRVTTNGAGTSLGVNSRHFVQNFIEHGTRFLCGNGKKVTVSFWAKSDIASKKLGLFLVQSYGTGGTPTTAENIDGTNWTLTSTWTKYTYTFTTNTLVGKTFGTANDDYLLINFMYMWGTDRAVRVGAGTTAESYVGSGNIDIAQVQLCAGDVALPFQPKSFAQELQDCMRYCYGVTTTTTVGLIAMGHAISTTVAYVNLFMPVEMRIVPALTATAGDWQLRNIADAAVDVTALVVDDGLYSQLKTYMLKATVASGLTAYRPYFLAGDGNSGRVLILSAEL